MFVVGVVFFVVVEVVVVGVVVFGVVVIVVVVCVVVGVGVVDVLDGCFVVVVFVFNVDKGIEVDLGKLGFIL